MLVNYCKIALRNLYKNKLFSVLNITGLSIGVSCFLLISLYINDELGYDKYNTNADRIYRIGQQIKISDFKYDGTQVPAIMGPSFAKDFKQIERYIRFKDNAGIVIKKGEENIRENKVIYADSTLFEVFSLSMIFGNPLTALKEPHSLVITESTSKKYFNSLDAIGKTLLVNNNTLYKITGVIKDIPEQSHFNFDFFMPVCELAESRDNNWLNTNFVTYLLLKQGTDAKQLQKQMNLKMTDYETPQLKTELNLNREQFQKAGNFITCNLMPLTDIHLHSNVTYELGTNGSIQNVYIFSAIAIFILLVACVNFMNLSTAQSSKRAIEVGIRKVIGSNRSNLIAQFLSESLLISLFSFILAVIMVVQFMPAFNKLSGKNINILLLLRPGPILIIVLLMIIVGLIAGSYPAFLLSSFQPNVVLKGKLSKGFKGSLLRNSMVVFQFSVSIILTICTAVIYMQLQYIRDTNIGFNKEQVLVIKNTYALNNNSSTFANELMKIPGVKSVTRTAYLPINGYRGDRGFITTPKYDGKNFTLMQMWPVDENYIPTLQMVLKKGRNFSSQIKTDSSAVIINEAAAKYFGEGDPINKNIYRLDDLVTGKLIVYKIIGIIKNFNFNSLHEQVGPLVLNMQEDNASIALRIDTRKTPFLLDLIKAKWKSLDPAQPFSYSFLNDDYNKQYISEQHTGSISMVFSVLAILIGCLGLFGLVTYAAVQRTKEIGIRKVLGAKVIGIVAMLSKEFAKLVLISCLISFPVAWLVMNKWLQDFAYRIHIQWWVFVFSGSLALLIAMITVSFQAINAAVANPVKSLKTE